MFDLFNKYKVSEFGKYAIYIEWPDEINPELNRLIRYLAEALNDFPRTEEVVVSYHALLWVLDSYIKDVEEYLPIIEEKRTSIFQLNRPLIPEIIHLPVCYDRKYGKDIDKAVEKLGISVDQMIDMHSKSGYYVFAIGFLPGFPFLGGLVEQLHLRRLAQPRKSVKKGSVGIGGKQTGIYPVDSPGGWNIIGYCPIPLFYPFDPQLALLEAGNKVQFYSISLKECARWEEKFKNKTISVYKTKAILNAAIH